jgi:hypothetical protein
LEYANSGVTIQNHENDFEINPNCASPIYTYILAAERLTKKIIICTMGLPSV